MPGWIEHSWGYHGDDGKVFHSKGSGEAYADCFTTGDIIGCGVDFKRSAAFFTKNGVSLGNEPNLHRSFKLVRLLLTNGGTGDAFRGVHGQLYPQIGLRSQGARVKVNFGKSPFIFRG